MTTMTDDDDYGDEDNDEDNNDDSDKDLRTDAVTSKTEVFERKFTSAKERKNGYVQFLKMFQFLALGLGGS